MHVGLGHPGHGQPASQKNFHKERSGLEGRGVEGMVEILSAEDRLPTRAEELATERQ